MLVNQIQRDMNSNNVLEISAALAAVNKIVTEDMVPAVIGDVSTHIILRFLLCNFCYNMFSWLLKFARIIHACLFLFASSINVSSVPNFPGVEQVLKLLRHEMEAVRKKAVGAMHR